LDVFSVGLIGIERAADTQPNGHNINNIMDQNPDTNHINNTIDVFPLGLSGIERAVQTHSKVHNIDNITDGNPDAHHIDNTMAGLTSTERPVEMEHFEQDAISTSTLNDR